MRYDPICVHCNRPESEHHEFEEIPYECHCEPGSWLYNVPDAVCNAYIDDGNGSCKTCEHDRECHKP